MTELVGALERGRVRRRVRMAVGVVVAVGLIVGGVLGWQRWDVARRTARCAAEGAAIAGTWNDERRAAMQAAFVASGARFAATTAEKVTPWLDRQATAWQQARSEACVRGEVDGTWDADTLRRARGCLDERQMELTALVDELVRADATTVEHAVPAVASLGAVASCLVEASLQAQAMASAEDGAAVQALRADLSRSLALDRAGKIREGLALATQTHARAQELGWRPLVVVARNAEGNRLRDAAAYGPAETALREACLEAVRLGLWDVAADAATVLIAVVGDDLARPAEGRTWYGFAEALAEHASDPEQLREAARLGNLALVETSVGEYAAATTLHEQALVLRERALGPDHPAVARSVNNLAIARASVGATEEARALFARAVAIKEEALGPDHPEVGESLGNLAMATEDAGDPAAAEGLYRRAIGVLATSLGAGHPHVATMQMSLAELLRKRGEYAEALTLSRDAVVSFEAALGADHPDVASALVNLGNLHITMGAYAEARALFVRAIPILERRLGETHPELAMMLNNLAYIELVTGHANAALPLAERAVAIFEGHAGEQTGEPEAHLCLAQAIVAANGERARARTETARAREGFLMAGAAKAGELAELETWAAEQL